MRNKGAAYKINFLKLICFTAKFVFPIFRLIWKVGITILFSSDPKDNSYLIKNPAQKPSFLLVRIDPV